MRALLATLAVAAAVSTAHAGEHALIVTNNKSLGLGRPDLQYADDDGAKWLELYDGLYGPGHATLLARFDAPTRALFPALAPNPPTLAALDAALADLTRALIAEPVGDRVVTLVFAGHGDVADGEGFVELEDGPLTATGLASRIAALPADRIHLVIDACNAWFMLHPRKPGGKRVARDPRATVDGLLERDPRVGALLSTSAEATTWEWSEIQSGLFSHALRSGLRGGADVDRDRRVTYRELDGFLAVANETVPETYRPRLFVRAPAVDREPTGQVLVRLDGEHARARTLDLPTARRIALRDARGVRLLDGHFEAGPGLTLVLPASELAMDEAITQDGRPTRRSATLAADAQAIAALDPAAPTVAPDLAGRGDVLRIEQLFAHPFGPEAFARWASAPAPEEVPYGVTRGDAERLGHVLASGARLERRSRELGGVTTLGLGVLTGGLGAAILGGDQDDRHLVGGVLLGTSALSFVTGGFALVASGELEDIDSDFRLAPKGTERERALTVARFERLLAERADDYRTTRLWTSGFSIGLGVLGLAAGTVRWLSDGRFSENTAFLLGTGVFIGGLGAYGFASKHQVEEVWDLYQDLREIPWQPGTSPAWSPVVAPVEGGLVLGINGAF